MKSRREEWVKRVAGWRRSGVTANEYAASIGVKATTLTHWAWQLGYERRQKSNRRDPRGSIHTPAVIEVVSREARTEAGFELQLTGGRRLQIPANFDAAALTRLLVVLEGAR